MRSRIAILLALICAATFAASTTANIQTSAGAISGTVKDPNGAVIAGARIIIRGQAGEPRAATTNDEGRFRVEDLAPGRYTVNVSYSGFKSIDREVVIEATRTATIEIRLEVAAPRAEISVAGKGAVAANAEPNYRGLRDGESLETFAVNNLVIKRDVGAFTLRNGRISFLAPVMNRVVKAVFVGEGEFTLMPAIVVERDYLRLVIEKDSVSEPFAKAAFCFTDDTYQEIKRQSQAVSDESNMRDLLRDFQKRVRHRTERPRSYLEYLIAYEGENLDAEILADLYNPKNRGFFSAYIYGKNYSDLRFHVRPRSALPQMLSPEEVALLNVDPQGEKEGVWYLAHFIDEYKSGQASSEEDHRSIDAEHYRIETAIDGGEKLTATAEFTFTALRDGERVLSFGLLPNLRVTRVSSGDRDVNFIQEPRKEDGSFYIVLPDPLVKNNKYNLKIEYQGDKVVEDEGGGNFAVGARTSWYPSVNAFNDRATFDLIFKIPKQYTLVGVGKLTKEWREGDFAASQWVSEVPLAVAGFNYGQFKKKEIADAAIKYQIEGYATSRLPDYMKGVENAIGGMTPTRMTEVAMVEAQNSLRIFSNWFGEAPYGRIAITQQPQFNFGQSWPTLVYLPISAFFDSTQRFMLLGPNSSRFTEFIQEVTPHEVAHQWWGHIVGWSSYHDQWLSEGFADFSAGLFLQITEQKPDKYLNFWKRAREVILEKNTFGRRPNDAGPIWMGVRLNTYKTAGAYNRLIYPKGGYVLHMLRWMMHNNKTGDQKFIEMMRDFVKTYTHRNASTEGFKKIVEKHMLKTMDLDGNGRMDWFFGEWVYGTEVPRYKFEYSLAPDTDGKFMLKGTVTQSGVSENFKMLVPIYLDFNGKIIRLGDIAVQGNSSTEEFKVRLPEKPRRVLINANHDILATDVENVQK